MSVTIEDVRRVARLARLSFSEEEERDLVSDLTIILEYMEQLAAINPDSVDASSYDGKIVPHLREDVVHPPIDRSDALRNASATSGEYFEVPKVI